MEEIKLDLEKQDVCIMDTNDDYGCGTIDGESLYLIDKKNAVAYKLPEEYKNTPMFVYPSVGGYSDGLIMVSLMEDMSMSLQYHHDKGSAAGMWGWIDTEGKVIIKPQYIFATHFYNNKAIVCKGEWLKNENDKYWVSEEKWGIINKKNEEIVPCSFDEINEIDNTENYYLCHKDGWKN